MSPRRCPIFAITSGSSNIFFINTHSVPHGSVGGVATCIAGVGRVMGLRNVNRGACGILIAIGTTARAGSIMKKGWLSQTVGEMAHDLGHKMEMTDLYLSAYAETDRR